MKLALRVKGKENRRLRRRLARAPEAVAGRPVAWPLPWECRAAQSRQARPRSRRSQAGAQPRGAVGLTQITTPKTLVTLPQPSQPGKGGSCHFTTPLPATTSQPTRLLAREYFACIGETWDKP
eukprot:scaffold126894_cov51-Phaeocystis_antarctica.AAC.2